MNNKKENIKKLVIALADLFIVWKIKIERKQSQTQGTPKNEHQKLR